MSKETEDYRKAKEALEQYNREAKRRKEREETEKWRRLNQKVNDTRANVPWWRR